MLTMRYPTLREAPGDCMLAIQLTAEHRSCDSGHHAGTRLCFANTRYLRLGGVDAY